MGQLYRVVSPTLNPLVAVQSLTGRIAPLAVSPIVSDNMSFVDVLISNGPGARTLGHAHNASIDVMIAR